MLKSAGFTTSLQPHCLFPSTRQHTLNQKTSCMLVVSLPCDFERTGKGEKKKSIGNQIGEILPITLPVSHSTHRITDTAAAAALVAAHPLQTHTNTHSLTGGTHKQAVCTDMLSLFLYCDCFLFFYVCVTQNIMIYFYHSSLFLSPTDIN